jgi:FkbM family methyltransferase
MNNNLDILNFDWGWMEDPSDVYQVLSDGSHKSMGQYHKDSIYQEIFIDKCYEKFFEVEAGDIVLDIGASLGPFTYSILHKNPKHVFCFEPSDREFKTLVKNTMGFQVTPINKGISNVNSIVSSDMLFGGETEMETITFNRFISLFGLEKIDFIKTDCEGGEYDIFTKENLDFLKRVSKITGEWHLHSPEEKEKFKNFRDSILVHFPKYEIFSINGVDIKWDLWNEKFIEYYSQIIIHINNK